jgi:hypothetical protein
MRDPIADRQIRRVRPTLSRPALALAALAASGASMAEPTPYYIGATQSLTHDSNVYGVPNGRSDNYGSTGIVGGFDQAIGRQRVYASGTVRDNYYQHETRLDNVSYSLNAGWNLSTIENISGGVSVDASRSLASTNNNSIAQPIAARNIVDTRQLGARVGWGGAGALGLDANYGYSQSSYSDTSSSNSSSQSGSVGGTYRLGPTVRLGLAYRVTRSDNPDGVLVSPGVYDSNSSSGRNVDFNATWQTSATTGVNGRLSFTRLSNSVANSRDFSGLTGSIAASYAPTTKLAFNAGLSRDAGTNGSTVNFANSTNNTPVVGLSEASTTTTTASLGASYAATAKVGVNAGLQYRRSTGVNLFTVGGASVGGDSTDSSTSASLGASYAAARWLSMGCNLGYTRRSFNTAAALDYSGTTIGCTAQLTLR